MEWLSTRPEGSDLVQIMDPRAGRPRTCTCRSVAISSVWCLYLKAAASTLELSVCVYLISQFQGNKRRKLAYLGGWWCWAKLKRKHDARSRVNFNGLEDIFLFQTKRSNWFNGWNSFGRKEGVTGYQRFTGREWNKWQKLIRVNKIYMWKLNKTISSQR